MHRCQQVMSLNNPLPQDVPVPEEENMSEAPESGPVQDELIPELEEGSQTWEEMAEENVELNMMMEMRNKIIQLEKMLHQQSEKSEDVQGQLMEQLKEERIRRDEGNRIRMLEGDSLRMKTVKDYVPKEPKGDRTSLKKAKYDVKAYVGAFARYGAGRTPKWKTFLRERKPMEDADHLDYADIGRVKRELDLAKKSGMSEFDEERDKKKIHRKKLF